MFTISFPMYDTPTGRIVGTCLLGKPDMCKEFLKSDKGFFPEGGGNVDPLTALCYYAADRRYQLKTINEHLKIDDVIILDRYTTSNMAHRGGMIEDKDERLNIYNKIEQLEYSILELPRPDKVIFLHLPYEYACELKKNKEEPPYEDETNVKFLKNGERAYLELAEIYGYSTIDCAKDDQIKSIEEIHEEVYTKVKEMLGK